MEDIDSILYSLSGGDLLKYNELNNVRESELLKFYYLKLLKEVNELIDRIAYYEYLDEQRN